MAGEDTRSLFSLRQSRSRIYSSRYQDKRVYTQQKRQGTPTFLKSFFTRLSRASEVYRFIPEKEKPERFSSFFLGFIVFLIFRFNFFFYILFVWVFFSLSLFFLFGNSQNSSIVISFNPFSSCFTLVIHPPYIT